MHSISVSLAVSAFTKHKPRPRAKTAQPWSDQHRGGTSEPRRQWSQTFDVLSRELPSVEIHDTTLENEVSAVVGKEETGGGCCFGVVRSELSDILHFASSFVMTLETTGL